MMMGIALWHCFQLQILQKALSFALTSLATLPGTSMASTITHRKLILLSKFWFAALMCTLFPLHKSPVSHIQMKLVRWIAALSYIWMTLKGLTYPNPPYPLWVISLKGSVHILKTNMVLLNWTLNTFTGCWCLFFQHGDCCF